MRKPARTAVPGAPAATLYNALFKCFYSRHWSEAERRGGEMSSNIESVLSETRVFPPSEAFVKQANISGMAAYHAMCKDAEQDFEAIAELSPQFLNRLHPLLVGCQGRPDLARVEVKVVGQRDAGHPEGDRQRRVDVERHLRVGGEEGV